MVVLILAAGYATRLYPYTLGTPKPLLPVGGKPLIDYIISQADTIPDVSEIMVVTNDKFYERFAEWNDNRNGRFTIINDGTCSVDTRLGAIGDISFALKRESIDDDLIVIAGDNLFTYSLREMYDYFRSTDKNCICVKELESKDKELLKSFGVCMLDENGKVIHFEEKPAQPRSNFAVYATYMLKKSSLHFIDEFIANDSKKDAPGYFVEWLHKKTDVYAYLMNGECYDIGTVDAYERIRDNFRAM